MDDGVRQFQIASVDALSKVAREGALSERETSIRAREVEVEKREAALIAATALLAQRERDLILREQEFEKRADLFDREYQRKMSELNTLQGKLQWRADWLERDAQLTVRRR
jgi:hypothetical protein